MRVVIDGVSFENPTKLRIEVAPEGETVGPWQIEIVGGQLTVKGQDEPALTIMGSHRLDLQNAGAALLIYTPPLTFTADNAGVEGGLLNLEEVLGEDILGESEPFDMEIKWPPAEVDLGNLPSEPPRLVGYDTKPDSWRDKPPLL